MILQIEALKDKFNASVPIRHKLLRHKDLSHLVYRQIRCLPLLAFHTGCKPFVDNLHLLGQGRQAIRLGERDFEFS